MKIALNDNWKFTRYWDADMVREDYNDTMLDSVRLPHMIRDIPLNYVDESVFQLDVGYRYTLEWQEEFAGKRVELVLGAAAHVATVYLNGREIGRHGCGYTEFHTDLTEYLKKGNNALVVRCDSRMNNNVPPFGHVVDYMTFGGMYRNAWLEVKNPVCIKDVFVFTSHVNDEEKTLHTEVTIDGYKEGLVIHQQLKVHTPVTGCDETNARMSAEGVCQNYLQWVSRNTMEPEQEELKEEPLTDSKTMIRRGIKHVSLWTPKMPSLYDLTVQLYDQGGDLLDEKVVVTGFREARFEKDGFFLNGEKVKLRGMNRHQSYPYVGYAMPRSMQEMDADILKWELRLNAVRTSHYPQSQDFINRCDEIGLMVFTEMPGWQYIGNEAWQDQAVTNVEEMVIQYRNHPSIILWGVRINESGDCHDFYMRTNHAAHTLDPSRQTGGVRCIKKSELLEDVYTYNDFSCDSIRGGCEEKSAVTLDSHKGYLISEYGGHMFPCKPFDCEENRLEQALRHVAVLRVAADKPEIAGTFGWCMFDYNSNKDFGSGDRVCYHGVLDMFRNPKLAAAVYASQTDEEPVLCVSSSMNVGEHPACVLGNIYAFTNAEKLRLYKNDKFIKEYTCKAIPTSDIPHLPVLLDDFIGNEIVEKEGFSQQKAENIKEVLQAYSRYGANNLPQREKLKAARVMLQYHMTFDDTWDLFNKYVGNWGDSVTVYKVEAVKEDKVVKTVTIRPGEQVQIVATVDHRHLVEQDTYDVAAVRLNAVDEFGNHLPFYQQPMCLKIEGDIALIGPETIAFSGGYAGVYVKTINGKSGHAKLQMITAQADTIEITFELN